MSLRMKAAVLVCLAYLLGCLILPLPAEASALLQLLWVPLSIGFAVLLFRDLNERDFPNPESKLIWTFLLVLLAPFSMPVYLYKHGFRPRPVVEHRHDLGRARLGSVVAVCTITYVKVVIACAFGIVALVAATGNGLEGLDPIQSKAVSLFALLGAIGIGYPFSLAPVEGAGRWITAAPCLFPLCLVVAGLCDEEARSDGNYWIVGGIALLAIVLVAVDLLMSRTRNRMGQESSVDSTLQK